MVSCTIFENVESLSDLLVWPTLCAPYFYLIIFICLIAIIGWGIYRLEDKKNNRGNLLSSFAVSSLAFTILAVFGTLIKNSLDIPMITSDVLLYLIAITIVLDSLWIFQKRNNSM